MRVLDSSPCGVGRKSALTRQEADHGRDCVVCAAPPVQALERQRTGAALIYCTRRPTPSAGSVQSIPRWHQCSTEAFLLSRGSLPRYHSEHAPPALRSSPPTSPAGGRPACVPGCALTQPGLTAVCWLSLRCPVCPKQAGEHGQAQPLPYGLE